jgi:hypothetical protein
MPFVISVVIIDEVKVKEDMWAFVGLYAVMNIRAP